jgi:nucleotide-binding universal stress UspA family protein
LLRKNAATIGIAFAMTQAMTPTIQKILLPIDFSVPSERAAGYAATLARSLGASVHLVHVLEEPFMTHGPWQFHLPDTPELRDSLYAERRSRLAVVAESMGVTPDRVSTEVRAGRVADGIQAAAADYGCDLIVMATHGRSGLPHLVLGSVAEDVIRHARCPVLAVRESGAAGVRIGTTAA